MPDRERILDIGEDALVARVIARYGPPPPHVLVGPGDDAAVVDLTGPVAASTDTLVEGYDFRREWSTPRHIGIKTAAQNLADIAAMGARPLALMVSLAAPADLPEQWAADLAEGLAQEWGRAGAAVVGGDVSQCDQIVITGSALGTLCGPAVLRSGARAGDVLALAGLTGPSAAGLALLRAGVETEPDPLLAALVEQHRAPRPDYPAGGRAAAAGAHAMIDTSDGLVRDALRLARASSVRIDLDPAALRPGPDLLRAEAAIADAAAGEPAAEDGQDTAWVRSLPDLVTSWVLACFPPDAELPEPFRRVGSVLALDRPAEQAGQPDADDGWLTLGGRPWQGATGWRHFAR